VGPFGYFSVTKSDIPCVRSGAENERAFLVLLSIQKYSHCTPRAPRLTVDRQIIIIKGETNIVFK